MAYAISLRTEAFAMSLVSCVDTVNQTLHSTIFGPVSSHSLVSIVAVARDVYI